MSPMRLSRNVCQNQLSNTKDTKRCFYCLQNLRVKLFYIGISQHSTILSLENELELNLRFVRIYFDVTTFDRITKDRAAKFVDMLSAIGGTMGLLTGFSIISGVEIVYFGVKIILKILRDRIDYKQKTIEAKQLNKYNTA